MMDVRDSQQDLKSQGSPRNPEESFEKSHLPARSGGRACLGN